MTMLEKAARAACEDAGFDPDEMMANGGPRWRYYVPTARAVLAAIREPDERMLDRGACYEDPDDRYAEDVSLGIRNEGDIARDVHRAMIDAILEGDPNAG